MAMTVEEFVKAEPGRRAASQRDCRDMYRGLLLVDALNEDQQAILSDLLARLGKQPDDLLKDKERLKKLAALEKESRAIDHKALRSAELEARKRFDEVSKDSREMTRRLAEAQVAWKFAQGRSDSAERLGIRVAKMKGELEDLF